MQIPSFEGIFLFVYICVMTPNEAADMLLKHIDKSTTEVTCTCEVAALKDAVMVLVRASVSSGPFPNQHSKDITVNRSEVQVWP